MVGLRDFYAFMTDSRVKRMGGTAWIMLAMMLMEALVVGKFARNLSNVSPIPNAVVYAWSAAALAFAAFVVYQFTTVKHDVGRLFPAPPPALQGELGGAPPAAPPSTPGPSSSPLGGGEVRRRRPSVAH